MGADSATDLNKLIRAGTVSTVNAAERTATVFFEDTENLVSAPLKILKNGPFIPAKDITQETQPRGGGPPGDSAFAEHTHEVIIKPWLPDVGDFVLCVFPANGGGDGYVVGGI
jgi:hypothetical protein